MVIDLPSGARQLQPVPTLVNVSEAYAAYAATTIAISKHATPSMMNVMIFNTINATMAQKFFVMPDTTPKIPGIRN